MACAAGREDGEGVPWQMQRGRSQMAAWGPKVKGYRVGPRSGRGWAQVKVVPCYTGSRDEGAQEAGSGGRGDCVRPQRSGGANCHLRARVLGWRVAVGQERMSSWQLGTRSSCHLHVCSLLAGLSRGPTLSRRRWRVSWTGAYALWPPPPSRPSRGSSPWMGCCRPW